MKGLIDNGINIIECNERSPILLKVNKGKYIFNFIKRSLKLLKKIIDTHDFDLVIVGYPGYESVFQIRRLTKKPIIYDPFVSSYLSYVYDYKFIKENSFLSKLYYLVDYISFKQADLILSDTSIHGKIFSKLLYQKEDKFKTILVGSDPEIFYPQKYENEKNNFIISFYGGYIPLQGLKIILAASKILKSYSDIKFEIIGGGPENKLFQEVVRFKVKNNLDNVDLIPHIPINQLPQKIAKSEIQLGIFGGTLKSNIVIPNKVYSALAMKKPVITADTIAIRELLTHEKNVFLCKNADIDSLVNAIINLYEDKNLRSKIAGNGYKIFEEYLTPQKLGKVLKNLILKLL